MTFNEWWKLPKPAECDEVKQYFEECWRISHDAALERAAEICDRAEIFAWEQWIATGNQHNEGARDGATSLARDIRALMELP